MLLLLNECSCSDDLEVPLARVTFLFTHNSFLGISVLYSIANKCQSKYVDNIITSLKNEIRHFTQTVAFWIYLIFLRAEGWSLSPHSKIAPSQSCMHISKNQTKKNLICQLPCLTPNMVAKQPISDWVASRLSFKSQFFLKNDYCQEKFQFWKCYALLIHLSLI